MPIQQLVLALFAGIFIAPFTAFFQYVALKLLNNDYVRENLNDYGKNEDVPLTSICAYVFTALFISFVVAALFEEVCKRFVLDTWTNINMNYLNYHHNEKKYYKNNHQYNVRSLNYGGAGSTSIATQQDPIQTLLFFHFIGLGFSLFENILSTFYINSSRVSFENRPMKLSIHHSLYISTLHCVCCAITASQIFRRDFYGGYELINRGRSGIGYLHILFPSILIHGSFDLIALLIKFSMKFNQHDNFTSIEQLSCIALQTALLVGSIFYVEYTLNRLNVYELSYAVRDLENLSIVSVV
jgi:RsiW-degrading membrane proteinase PrsW (M82 family)